MARLICDFHNASIVAVELMALQLKLNLAVVHSTISVMATLVYKGENTNHSER